jgi:hypothetical protein
MAEKKAHELLSKHRIDVADVAAKRVGLHHLRNIVRSENLPYDVFRELVKLRK